MKLDGILIFFYRFILLGGIIGFVDEEVKVGFVNLWMYSIFL